jgi:hypothetical protein
VDKYLGSAGNTLDPDEVRMLFRPLGYTGPNANDYAEAEQLVVNAVFEKMIQKALRAGRKDIVIVTGPPASGKSTAVKKLNLKKAGLIYDATLIGDGRLADVIRKAKGLGMEKVTVVPVYNDVLTSYKNSLNRGKMTWRYTALDYMVNAFRDNIGKLDQIRRDFPDVEIIPVDCSNNKGWIRVTIDEARKWNYEVTEKEMTQLFTCLLDEINNGEIEAGSVPAATGNILSIKTTGEANAALAKEIDRKVNEIIQEFKMR